MLFWGGSSTCEIVSHGVISIGPVVAMPDSVGINGEADGVSVVHENFSVKSILFKLNKHVLILFIS